MKKVFSVLGRFSFFINNSKQSPGHASVNFEEIIRGNFLPNFYNPLLQLFDIFKPPISTIYLPSHETPDKATKWAAKESMSRLLFGAQLL